MSMSTFNIFFTCCWF